MTRERDIDLVESCLSGNRAAFGDLLTRYQTRIYNVTLRITGNPEDAMDATQSAFLKAFDNLGSFDTDRSFFSWACRIGVNEALNVLKKNKRLAPLEFEAIASTPGPEQAYQSQETGLRVREALEALSPDYRTVVVLRHFHQLSYKEMSEILEIPVKTVKSRLFTARRSLRDILLRKRLIS